MKHKLFALALACSSVMVAQELPMPSPTATLEQRIGLTDFTIHYSRPGVKEREIFGNLVPYDKLWRTGANANTTIEFNTDVSFAGKTVSAGKYSLFTIPGEKEWTIILNKKTDHGGTVGYDEKNDIIRFDIEPVSGDMTESFTIEFDDIRNETATLVIDWEKTEVEIPLRVEVMDKAQENIKNALSTASKEDEWKVYRNAANFYHNNDIEAKKALDYIDKSIAANDQSWYSYWLKAEILAGQEKYEEAVASAEKAKDVGMREAKEKGSEFGYAEMIDGGISTWKKMN